MLSTVFELTKLHGYTYGRKVTAYNDHKPLSPYWRNVLKKNYVMLDFNECFVESWDMTSNKKYVKGKELLIADSLSRSQTTNQNRSKIEEEIETKRLVHEDQSSKSHLAEIAEATAKDAVLQSVILHHISMGWKSSEPNVPVVGICVTPTIYEVSRYLCDLNYEVSMQLPLWARLWSERVSLWAWSRI